MRADPRDDDEFGAIVEAHSSPDADGLSDEAREVQAVAVMLAEIVRELRALRIAVERGGRNRYSDTRAED